MKILLYSHFFAPSIGGVETIVLSLARGLAELRSPKGDPEFDLVLVTQTPAENFDDCSLAFRTVRRPTIVQLWHLIRGSDVIHIAGPSLAPLFLSWLARKPVILEHHGYQAICPNGLLLHEPDKSVVPATFKPAVMRNACDATHRELPGSGVGSASCLCSFATGSQDALL